MIKYELGHIDNKFEEEQKFVVTRDGNSLLYHAKSAVPYHRTIVEQLELKNIVGGGEVSRLTTDRKHELSIWGNSTNYGGIPSEIMVGFHAQLLEVYKRIVLGLKKLNISTYCYIAGNKIEAKQWLKYRGIR